MTVVIIITSTWSVNQYEVIIFDSAPAAVSLLLGMDCITKTLQITPVLSEASSIFAASLYAALKE
jgi:hypothetical protein